MTPTSVLNLNQSPDELRDVYDRNYYRYLDSPEFHETFLTPIGQIVDSFGQPVLDVGCGEGQLSDHILSPYLGIDGSETAIKKAIEKRATDRKRFQFERFETYQNGREWFGTVVFGGIMEVLVKPDYRVPLMMQYAERFATDQFVIYDLERLDTSLIEQKYKLIHRQSLSVVIDNLEDVKKHRKIMVFSCR